MVGASLTDLDAQVGKMLALLPSLVARDLLHQLPTLAASLGGAEQRRRHANLTRRG
jgi:hypothetical protein